MEPKIIDLNGLNFFKQQLEINHEAKFMQFADFTDENGIILSDKLPSAVAPEIASLEEISGLFGTTEEEEEP